jgi:peroxiredoxin
MTYNWESLPTDLPVPEDDGAADHLRGAELPHLSLPSTAGTELDLRQESEGTLVLYVYPRTGKPGEPLLPGWDDIPGARGCTPESCSFRDHAADLERLGARVLGLSAQSLEDQHEFAERVGLPYPILSDTNLELAEALRLPTFETSGLKLYKRITLIVREHKIVHVFYPVFPPDEAAATVLSRLQADAREPAPPAP